MLPPRARWATTVKASAPTARNQARRWPRRTPRAIMIMAMPATAVSAAADWATPRGRTESTACRRLRSGGDAVTATLIRPSSRSSPLAQRRTARWRRCSARRSTVTGKGLPGGQDPTIEVKCEGAGWTGGRRDQALEQRAPAQRCSPA